MKKMLALAARCSAVVLILLSTAACSYAQKLDGAWKMVATGTVETVCVIEDGYFMQTTFDKTNKLFIATTGGTMKVNDNGSMDVTIEFNTSDSTWVGNSHTLSYKLENGQLLINVNGSEQAWQRIDDGKAALAGNWRITAREQNGQMNEMKPGPRKTLKILSGTRFQWAAINTDTKEFFGTGGGSYTFADGKYTENIEFFSRDNSRVGASLSFNGKVEGKRWHHSGKSSKGDPISEIWSRQ
ncbi:MAG TPA: hypothetical protein VM488_17030 [Pseudobacter sp.]|nr:hypothetical protein [Pseudobacter sp.]